MKFKNIILVTFFFLGILFLNAQQAQAEITCSRCSNTYGCEYDTFYSNASVCDANAGPNGRAYPGGGSDGVLRSTVPPGQCGAKSDNTRCAPYTNNPIGYSDPIVCTPTVQYFKGWTCDPDGYPFTTTSHIYVDGNFLGGIAADVNRPDVASSCGGYPNHGIMYPIPSYLLDGNPHTINMYAINDYGPTNPQLNLSPRTLQCKVCPDIPSRTYGCAKTGNYVSSDNQCNNPIGTPPYYADQTQKMKSDNSYCIAPPAPTNLTATCTNGTLSFNWAQVNSPTAGGYYKVTVNGNTVNAASNSYSLAGTSGQTYTWSVQKIAESDMVGPVTNGPSVYCGYTQPTAPVLQTASCVNQALSFPYTKIPGYTYAIRIDDTTANTWSGSCTSVNAGDTCLDNLSISPFTRAGINDHSYTAWVHAINQDGVVGPPASWNVVNCNPAAPSITTFSPTAGSYYQYDTATLTWTAGPSGATCKVTGDSTRNGLSATPPGNSVSVDPFTQVRTYSYTLTCTNSQGSVSKPLQISVGPASCLVNGVQDTSRGETGIDCGGGGCTACAVSFGQTSGVVFNGGNGFPQFGSTNNLGNLSMYGWLVGTVADGDSGLNSANPLALSYTKLLASQKQTGQDPTPIGCNLASCTLNTSANKVFIADGDLHLNAVNIVSGPDNKGRKIIVLVKGNLFIDGAITVDPGSAAVTGSIGIFAASGNIIINRSIGAAANSCVGAAQLQGVFSTEGTFIIDGNGAAGCITGNDDKMLIIEGNVITNAAYNDPLKKTNGFMDYSRRDLCEANASFPVVSIRQRPDFILNAPDIIKNQNLIFKEVQLTP